MLLSPIHPLGFRAPGAAPAAPVRSAGSRPPKNDLSEGNLGLPVTPAGSEGDVRHDRSMVKQRPVGGHPMAVDQSRKNGCTSVPNLTIIR